MKIDEKINDKGYFVCDIWLLDNLKIIYCMNKNYKFIYIWINIFIKLFVWLLKIKLYG